MELLLSLPLFISKGKILSELPPWMIVNVKKNISHKNSIKCISSRISEADAARRSAQGGCRCSLSHRGISLRMPLNVLKRRVLLMQANAMCLWRFGQPHQRAVQDTAA